MNLFMCRRLHLSTEWHDVYCIFLEYPKSLPSLEKLARARAYAIWAGPSWLSHDPVKGKRLSRPGPTIKHSRQSCQNIHYFWDPDRQLLSALPNSKNHPCILEGHLSTNPILSALLLEGPKFNIYVHFPLEDKQLKKISFLKWNQKHVNECQ